MASAPRQVPIISVLRIDIIVYSRPVEPCLYASNDTSEQAGQLIRVVFAAIGRATIASAVSAAFRHGSTIDGDAQGKMQ